MTRFFLFLASWFVFSMVLADSAFQSTIQPVPPHILAKMTPAVWHKGCPAFSSLSYVQLSYCGFDNKGHLGSLIVHKALANEVVEIFYLLH